MIRATETLSQLEARLEVAERDRDEARRRLSEIDQQAPVDDSSHCCHKCQQIDDELTGHYSFVFNVNQNNQQLEI